MRKKTINIDIIEEVRQFLLSNYINIEGRTLLLAFSSGIDSSVLLNVLLKLRNELKFNIAIAHVNYNLRGSDSIGDMELSKILAKKNNIQVYIKEIECNKYKNKNLQLGARIDRYNFFKSLYKKKFFDYLITAHHKDDLLETIIYRILKGSSSSVYKAMPSKSNYILRPLINVYRADIEKYAKKNNIEYREDVSNKESKYKRNKIRNIIIPLLEEINPSSKENIINFVKTIYAETRPLRLKSKIAYRKCVVDNVLYLSEFNNTKSLVQKRILKKIMHNNELEITSKRIGEILKIINSKNRNIKARFSNKYIIKQNDTLTIKSNNNIENIDNKKACINIEKGGIYNFNNLILKVEKINIDNRENINFKDNTKLYLNLDYPFTIRSKNNGDTIIDNYTNKKLKLKKIFIDLKIDYIEKNNIPVIEKDNIIRAVCFGLTCTSKKNRISKSAYITNENEVIVISYCLYQEQ